MEFGVVGDVLLTGPPPGASGADVTANLRQECWSRLEGCSMVLANLEAPITGRRQPAARKPYNFRFDPWITGLFDERFVLGLANNHIMDYGVEGLRDTLEALDRAGVRYAGAGTSLDRAREPHYREVAGIQTAVICAADPRFNAATASTAGTFPASPGLLRETVTEACRTARLVAVTIHMGLEHAPTPSRRQVALAEEALDAGARLVAFHHAHVVGGYSRKGPGLVLWGTGNYVFWYGSELKPQSAKRTAAWRVRYSQPAGAVSEVSVLPAAIGPDGVPRPVADELAARHRDQIRKHSRRVEGPLRRHLWRGLDMLKPGFVRVNLTNYGHLLRQRGFRFVWRSLVAGFRAQLAR